MGSTDTQLPSIISARRASSRTDIRRRPIATIPAAFSSFSANVAVSRWIEPFADLLMRPAVDDPGASLPLKKGRDARNNGLLVHVPAPVEVVAFRLGEIIALEWRV